MKLLSDVQDQILTRLKKQGPLTVDELAARLGVAKTAARRNLLSMEKRGLIERAFRNTARGRPCLTFRLAPSASRLFPSKEAELLNSLLQFLTDSGNDSLIDRFFEEYWEKRYRAIQARLAKKKHNTFENRLEALKDELEKEGFMPRSSLSRNGTQISLHECHCPIEAAATITRKPCQLEQRLISRVLNAPVSSTTVRNEHHGTCEFVLPVPRQNRK